VRYRCNAVVGVRCCCGLRRGLLFVFHSVHTSPLNLLVISSDFMASHSVSVKWKHKIDLRLSLPTLPHVVVPVVAFIQSIENRAYASPVLLPAIR